MTLDPAYAAAERTAAAQHLIARAQAEIIARWTISPPPDANAVSGDAGG